MVNAEGAHQLWGNKDPRPHRMGQKQTTENPPTCHKMSTAQSQLLLVFALSRHLIPHILRRIGTKDI